ncbi:MAG: ATPase [Bacteroidetes bacterium]|nr:ATPase [Bacteroidota bacterium]MCH8524799.1 hypothetical protein [Balneolales bacterium]
MRHPQLEITKASGERDTYDREKLRSSLRRSGAKENDIRRVVDEVEAQLRDGMSTRKIYRKAFQALKRDSVFAASRYQLKQAVMELGPSGYPFERYVGAIVESLGYRVSVGRVVHGICVTHELDVIGRKNGEIMLAECKFRNQPGSKTDVKVPLYFHSRFNDVAEAWKRDNGRAWRESGLGLPEEEIEPEIPSFTPWIITNAKFTDDAISYSSCAGIRLLGWDYPEKETLLTLIEESRLMPITILQKLTRRDKSLLLEEGVTTCRELYQNEIIMQKVGIDMPRIRRTMKELETVLR